MELRFAHTADYVAADSRGKLTIVGVFDIIWDGKKVRPIAFPPFYLVAAFEASVAEGSDHEIKIRLVDDDEVEQPGVVTGKLQLRSQGVGHPLSGHVLIGFGPEVVKVPDYGDYHFRFEVGGVQVGATRVSVLEAPPQS